MGGGGGGRGGKVVKLSTLPTVHQNDIKLKHKRKGLFATRKGIWSHAVSFSDSDDYFGSFCRDSKLSKKARFGDFAALSAERMQRRWNPTIPLVVHAWPHFLFYVDGVQIFVHGPK